MSIYCYTVGDIITSYQNLMRVNSLSGFRDFSFIGIARTLLKLGHVGVLVHSKEHGIFTCTIQRA